MLLPSLALTQIPVWIRAGGEELEVLASSPFTDGETEATEGTLTPALPLLFLAFLGLWTFLPAPTWPVPAPHPHSWAPVVKFQGCHCRGNSQLTGPLLSEPAPPLGVLHQAVVQGGGREGLPPLGD